MMVAGLPIELWIHIISYVAIEKKGLLPLLTVSRVVGAEAEKALYRDGLARFMEQEDARPIWRRIARNNRIAQHIRALWLFPLDREDLVLVREVLQATRNLKSVFLGLTDFSDPALELIPWSIVIPMSAAVPFQLRSLTVRTQDYVGMRHFMYSHQHINHLAVYHGVSDHPLTEDIPDTVQFAPEDVPRVQRLSVDDAELATKFLPHCTSITHVELSAALTLDGLVECRNIRVLKCRSTLLDAELERIPILFPNLEFLSVVLNGLVPAFDSLTLKCENLRKLKVWVNHGEWPGRWSETAELALAKTLGRGRDPYLEVIEMLRVQSGDQPKKVDILVVQIKVGASRQLQQISIQGDNMETQKNEWMWWGTKEPRG